jgi:hypothetical protein
MFVRSNVSLPCKITHGHARQALQGIHIRRDSPKIIAYPPILAERASCPQRPRDSDYGGKADHASEDYQHDAEIIAWNPHLSKPNLLMARTETQRTPTSF